MAISDTCRICGSEAKKIQDAKILSKYNIGYFKCQACSFVQTEKPYWLDEAYKNSINLSDTGLVWRNLNMANLATLLLATKFPKNGRFLDYGGGFGLFTRLMRDNGFDFYTTDPHTPNLMARGFEYAKQPIDLITCFECFEHFADPMRSINEMLKISRNILFSTELIPDPTPKINDWEYYGSSHGQHIAFYSRKQ